MRWIKQVSFGVRMWHASRVPSDYVEISTSCEACFGMPLHLENKIQSKCTFITAHLYNFTTIYNQTPYAPTLYLKPNSCKTYFIKNLLYLKPISPKTYFIQNLFHQNPIFICNQFHIKPISPKTYFIKTYFIQNLIHPKPIQYSPKTYFV